MLHQAGNDETPRFPDGQFIEINIPKKRFKTSWQSFMSFHTS